MPVLLECHYCHQSFRLKASAVAKGRGKYCSRTCFAQVKRPYTPRPSRQRAISCVCPVCQRLFKRHPTKIRHNGINYCSKTCKGIATKRQPNSVCMQCGTPMYVKVALQRQGRGLYCSNRCEGIRKRIDPDHRQEPRPHCKLPRKQWNMIKALYNYRCVYCGKKSQLLSRDHLTPVSRGGQDTVDNIVPACISCNARKHAGPVLKPVQPLLLLPCA